MKLITPKQYSELYGCYTQYIIRMLSENKIDKLPNVISVRKFSRFYLLEVPDDISKNNFIKNKK